MKCPLKKNIERSLSLFKRLKGPFFLAVPPQVHCGGFYADLPGVRGKHLLYGGTGIGL
jgi:hypothetical protein